MAAVLEEVEVLLVVVVVLEAVGVAPAEVEEGGGADYDVIRDLEHLQRESRETSNRYRDHDPEWSLNANQIHDELFFVLGLDVVSVIKI